MKSRLVIIVVLILAAWQLHWRWDRRAVAQEPGILVSEQPRQSGPSAKPFEFGAFHVIPRADFEIQARVLGSERYRFDAGARVSPLDLALGWGPMSDQAVVDQLSISQSARWFTLGWQNPPLPPAEIMRHSANMHMIPAQDWIEDILSDARVGQLIRLRGYLVEVSDDSGWRWRSSLSRDDTGDGSCELVFVQDAQILR